MSEAIFVEGLTKAYGGKTVVDHLDLSVKSGTVFGLLGANGAGKSTAIECMLGTKRADGGTVRLLGQDPSKRRRTLFQRIGVQFQEGDYKEYKKIAIFCMVHYWNNTEMCRSKVKCNPLLKNCEVVGGRWPYRDAPVWRWPCPRFSA